MSHTKSLVNWLLASQFAAVLIICSKITIPLGPIPLTGQTIAVGLIASLLTPMAGTLAILLYLLLGFIGLPVFAGSSTSLAVLLGPTGGYLWGFLAYVAVTSFWLAKQSYKWHHLSLANLVGALLQLVIGSLWLMLTNHMSLTQAFATGFIPFLLPAIVKVVIVVSMAKMIRQRTSLPLGNQARL